MPTLDVIVRQHVDALVADIKAAMRDNIADIIGEIRGAGNARRSSAPLVATPASSARRHRGTSKGQKRDMRCLTPDCPNTSRGPRFRYLCRVHQRASEKQVAEWRELRRKAKAA
jgi:hypothetical protein